MSKTMWKPYTFSYSKNISSDVYIADDTCYVSVEQMQLLFNVEEDRIIAILKSGFDSKEHESLHSIGVHKYDYTIPYYDLNALRFVSEKLNQYEVYSRFSDWVYSNKKDGNDSFIISMFFVEVILIIPIIFIFNIFIDKNINVFLITHILFAFLSPLWLLLLNDSFTFFVITSMIAGIGYAFGIGYYALLAFLVCFGFIVYGSFVERPYGIFNKNYRKPIQFGYNIMRSSLWNSLKKLE